jgi:hypothetical protein
MNQVAGNQDETMKLEPKTMKEGRFRGKQQQIKSSNQTVNYNTKETNKPKQDAIIVEPNRTETTSQEVKERVERVNFDFTNNQARSRQKV